MTPRDERDLADPVPVFDRPVLVPPFQRWQCCHCGGTGLDSYGEVCPHCEGLGLC